MMKMAVIDRARLGQFWVKVALSEGLFESHQQGLGTGMITVGGQVRLCDNVDHSWREEENGPV